MKATQAELHDNKAFAMLHDASAIRETHWEGMAADVAFAYLSGLMNLDDPLLDLGLHTMHLALVRNAFEDLTEFNKLFTSFPKTADGIAVDYKQCIALIHARAAMKKGIAYMPSGWIGRPGHFVAVKLQLVERNVFIVSYLQQGSGIQYHQPMIQGKYKTKYSYQSDPMLIDFDTALGENFLLGTVTLNYDDRVLKSDQVKKFSAIDLYGLLRLTGTPLPEYNPDHRQAVTPQRVGSCAITNAKLVANDVLIFLCDYSAKKIKRYTFGLKINSLQVAIDAYAEGKCDEKLLIWALREANVRINKHYPELITVNECMKANQLIQSVNIQPRVFNQPLPELVENVKEERLRIMQPTVVNNNNNIQPKLHKPPLVQNVYSYQIHQNILPHQIANTILDATEKLLDNEDDAYFYEFIKFLRSLPKTSGLIKDEFWDQVPLDHQTPILERLHKILRTLFEDYKDSVDAFEASLIVYDIAAQMATTHPELKLDNEYALGFSDVIPPCLQFDEPEIYYNIKHILLNFQKRCSSKQVIFSNDIFGHQFEDKTFQYLNGKILTPERRRVIVEILRKKGELKPGAEVENTADETFRFVALTGYCGKDSSTVFNTAEVFGDFYWSVLQLSALAHNLGTITPKPAYQLKQIHYSGQVRLLLHFNKTSRFSNELNILSDVARHSAGSSLSLILNHLPSARIAPKNKAYESEGSNNFYDFSENLITHPLDDLRQLNNADSTHTPPYQYRYGGTFHIGNSTWPKAIKNLRLESLDEEFRRIEAAGKMSILALLEWLLTHLVELELLEVRNRIDEILFSFGHLDFVLTSHTEETLRLMNEFFHVALYHNIDIIRHDHSNDQLNIFHFLCRLQLRLSQYIATAGALYNINIKSFRSIDVRSILMQLLNRCKLSKDRMHFADLLISSFLDRPPENTDDFYCMIRSKLFNELVNDETCCSYTAYNVWQLYYPILIRSLAGLPESELSVFMERALADILPPLKKSTWKIKNEVITCADPVLHVVINSGHIYLNGERIFDRKATLLSSPIVKTLPFDFSNAVFNYAPSRDNPDEIIMITAGGRWEFFTNNNMTIRKIHRNININSSEYRFMLIGASKNDIAQVKSAFTTNNLINPLGVDYTYAQDIKDRRQFFLQSIVSPNRGYLLSPKSVWLCIARNPDGNWQTTGFCRLDFHNPQLALEHNWRLALGQSIGYTLLTALAKIEKNTRVIIDSLSWQVFNLSFKNKDGNLHCDQHPGYFWRQLKRHPSLGELRSLIILENKHGNCKYLLPPFLLKKVQENDANKNKALSSEDFINSNETLAYPHCFEYELDRYGELCGTNDDANLYLAIIYRCLGDYRRAMSALKRSESLVCNTALQVSIARLTMSWPDLSALGAAFNCQILVRLYRHAVKWSKKSDHAFSDGQDLIKYCLDQLEWYFRNYSSRKNGICIIPHYMRLTPAELAICGQIEQKTNEKKKMQAEHSNAYLLTLCPNEERMQLNSLFQLNNWKHHFQYKFDLVSLGRKQYSKQVAPPVFSVRTFETGDVDDVSAKGYPGYEYLLRYFVNFFEAALSTDKQIEQRLIAQLFMLANNDIKKKSQQLIFLLIVVLQNKAIFQSLKNKRTDTMNCIYKILSKGTALRARSPGPVIPLEPKLTHLAGMVSSEDALVTVAKCQFNMDRYKTKPIHQYPYQATAKKYLFETSIPVATNPIMDSLMVGGSKIEYRLTTRYYEGNAINRALKKTEFQWLDQQLTLADLRKVLGNSLIKDQQLLSQLNDEMLLVANSAHVFKQTAEEAYFHCGRRGGQRNCIGIPEIFRAFLNQDYIDLLKMNPFLNQQHLDHLMSCIVEYALVQIRIDQAEAISKLEFNELQKIGRLLTSQRHYNVVDYPEFLVYEYATKRLLRLDQVESLCKLIKLIEEDETNVEKIRHTLLQFAAGGGKTAVIIPILVQRFARKGFLPVIINTNELYSIAIHEIPKNLAFAFQIDVEVIERELEHQWSVNELTRLHDDLMRWLADRKCLLLKPVTWHSINIASSMGYEQKNFELARAAEKVLDFFSEHTVMLEDEGHVTSDPLQQSIKTHGERLTVPIEQQQLIVEIYEQLLGVAPNSKAIAELAGIIYKSKKGHSEEELDNLQTMLVERIITFNAFRACDQAEIRKYLLQPEKTKPQWLLALRAAQPNQASLIVLGRAFVKTLLPHILTLQYNTDFGVSIHPGDLTAAPMCEGKHVTSHFADQMLVLSLTIQLYFITGIPAKNLEALITIFKQMHTTQSQYIKAGMTPAEQLLNTIIPRGVGVVSLDRLSTLRIREICSNPAVCYSFDVLKEYLFKIAFQQISTPKYRVESTAADFQAGFRRRITFSATPGLRELYYPSLTKEHYHELLSFEAEVLATLLRQKNNEACLIEMTHDPKSFFQQIKLGHPDFFKRMLTLIDHGALVSDLGPAAVTAALMELFDESDVRDATMHFEQGDMFIRAKQTKLNGAKAPGTNVAELLKRHGVKAEKLLLFLFLDLSKTTGTDVVRPLTDCAAITIGKGQTLSGTIQAAMRERLLLEENAQTVMWIMFKELYSKISSDEEKFDLHSICDWMIVNDARQLENRVINRSYQVINHVLIAEAKKQVRKNPAHYEKIRDVLHQQQILDPYLLYETESVQERPKKILDSYAEKLWKDLHLDTAHKLPPSSAILIENAVNETDELISLMTSPHGAELNAQVCQEQMQVVQQLQELEFNNLLNLGHDFKFNMEVYRDKFDSLQKIFFPFASIYAPMQIKIKGAKQDILYPKILINLAHFHPYELIRETRFLAYIKPFQALLVARLEDNAALQIVGCTSAGIQYFADQIKRVHANNKPRFALIGKNGHILCASSNMDAETKANFERDESLREAIVFSSLLDGEVKSIDQLVNLIIKYRWSQQDFNALIDTITSLHLSRTMVTLQNIPGLAERCGWKDASAPSQFNNTSHRPAESQLKLSDYPLLPRALSTRWSAARLNYQPRSVLSGVLFGEAPTSSIDLPIDDLEVANGYK